MSEEDQGGTQIYCPTCETITECKALHPSEEYYFGDIIFRSHNFMTQWTRPDIGAVADDESGRRFHFRDSPDIHWFRRGRLCLTCNNPFYTAEVDEFCLSKLAELLYAIRNIETITAANEKDLAAA